MKILEGGLNYFVIVKDFLLDLIFPKQCVSCRQEGKWICDDCLTKIDINIPDYICPLCKKETKSFLPGKICQNHNLNLDGLWIVTDYNNKVIQQAIHNLKYNFIEDLDEPLSEIINKYLRQINFVFEGNNFFDYIIPVPLHAKRSAERGFNQSELLANIIGSQLNCVVQTTILKRKHYTQPQASLGREERLKNLREAFICCDNSKIIGKNVILIDDVYTTGSTLQECAKILKLAGVRTIWGLAIAKSED